MSEWISTKERMPSLYKAVLAFHKKHGIVFGYRWLDYEESEDGPAEYCWEFQEGNSIPGKDSTLLWSEHWVAEDEYITHWMPLPKPPKKPIDKSLYIGKHFKFPYGNKLEWSQDFCCFRDNAPSDIEFKLYEIFNDEHVSLRAHGYGIISDDPHDYGNGSICMELKDILEYMEE